jgi:hypothetical protein
MSCSSTHRGSQVRQSIYFGRLQGTCAQAAKIANVCALANKYEMVEWCAEDTHTDRLIALKSRGYRQCGFAAVLGDILIGVLNHQYCLVRFLAQLFLVV